MQNVRKLPFLLFFLLMLATQAEALETLKGEEARSYIGDIRQRTAGGKYTYEILSRSHRDAMYGRFSDALIFNAEGGLFAYPRRKDSDHLVVIDSPEGREEEPVTEEAWRRKIQNVLSDDNSLPYVFLDDNRKEMAIVYVGKGTQVTSRINEGGLLEIGIRIEGATERGAGLGKRRRL
ncbi:MAG: hypothetical protein HY593_02375 [Candidatus Omnitrophica bacterium]|nr:hypothetical protein [Candidatus Omnitrophota bacterium]